MKQTEMRGNTRYVVESTTGEVLEMGYYEGDYYFTQDVITGEVINQERLSHVVALEGLSNHKNTLRGIWNQLAKDAGFQGPALVTENLRHL